MKVKQIASLLPAVAAFSTLAHASANLSGVVGATVVQSAAIVSPQFLPIVPCTPSPENATVLLVMFGAAGLFAGYRLRRVKQARTAIAL